MFLPRLVGLTSASMSDDSRRVLKYATYVVWETQVMRVVLTGASGQLGAYLRKHLLAEGHDLSAWSGSHTGEGLSAVDLDDPQAIDDALRRARPDLIIHAAAIATIEGVRLDPARGRAVNVSATEQLAEWSEREGARLVFTSTDLVFNGSKAWNREDDPVLPLMAYGRTKADAERAVLAVPRGLVARLSLLYGASVSGRPSPFDRTIEGLKRAEPQTLFVDEFRTPLHFAATADLLVRLAMTDVAGIIHVGGTERMSRFDLICRAAAALGLDERLVQGNRQCDIAFPEPRPGDVSLDTSRLASILPDVHRPSVEEALRLSHVKARSGHLT
jgi:dTDP-4-dehydrorhamnose reductase